LVRHIDKYWPRQFEELASDPIPQTVLTEPVMDNVIPLPKPRSLHAVLVESLTNTMLCWRGWRQARRCRGTGSEKLSASFMWRLEIRPKR
jgi:hypothetical protein